MPQGRPPRSTTPRLYGHFAHMTGQRPLSGPIPLVNACWTSVVSMLSTCPCKYPPNTSRCGVPPCPGQVQGIALPPRVHHAASRACHTKL